MNSNMTVDLSGKKILFFSPAFFSYENIIAEKMRELGAEVDLFDVRSVTGSFERALLKISPAFFPFKTKRYYEKIIKQNIDKIYDYIFIIKCDMTPISVLEDFRRLYPNAKLCLYLYDSVDNIPGIVKKFKYFDSIHTFDLSDCEKYKDLKFRPLFFGDQYLNSNFTEDDYIYDISFIGTIHSDRFAVIKQIQKIAKERNLNCYFFLYLQSKSIYYFYKFTKKEFLGVDKSCFSFDKMNASDIAEIIKKSRIVFDIQHPKQSGLTMRTIEMIGMKKKLITTNQNIKKYDFYNSNNIIVVDRKNVEITNDFLYSQYIDLPEKIYNKYSLKSWIIDVLS